MMDGRLLDTRKDERRGRVHSHQWMSAPQILFYAPDTAFSNSIVVRPGGTRPLMRERRPPANDAGTEFCVAWWLRDGCFTNCGRSRTHVPFASAGERTRLLNYCREHLAAPPAAGGAT